MTPQRARACHQMLDVLLAYCVAGETGEREPVYAALRGIDLSDLFAFEPQPDGSIRFEAGPLVSVISVPMRFFATGLAHQLGVTVDDVIATAREHIEHYTAAGDVA